MFLRPVFELTITQKPTKDFPNRNKIFFFDALCEYDIVSTPFNLTDTAEFIIPKDIYARDENNKLYPLAGTNRPLGGSTDTAPLFLKGDEVLFNVGYIFEDEDGTDIMQITGRNGLPDMFSGFIVQVASDSPFRLMCEDAMWKLKQIPVPKKTWTGYSVQKMFAEILSGSGYTVSTKSDITIDYDMGHFETKNETAAQVLARMRKELKFESYFRGKELRIGLPIYYEEEARTLDFAFQENIISSDLTYKRKDDIVLSAVVTTKVVKADNKKSKDGEAKIKTEDLEILVYTKPDGTFDYTSQKPFPENVEGERRTLNYNNVNEKRMFELGKAELEKYHYTGFRGHFLTFTLPFVKHGDNVNITNPKLPDQNGQYKVKALRYYGSDSTGARQEITVDYKINI